MSLRRIFTNGIILFMILFVVYLISSFITNYAEYDVLTFFASLEAQKAYIVFGVFSVSMFIGYVVHAILILIKKPKMEYKFVNVDEFASGIYRKLFMYIRDKNYDELLKICDEDGFRCLRLIFDENNQILIPLNVYCNISEYDHEEGIIVVTCVGLFVDNSTSRHVLKFVRTKDDSYVLNDIGGV
jgi:hypothetical protein